MPSGRPPFMPHGVSVSEPSPMIAAALELVRRALDRNESDPVARSETPASLAERIDVSIGRAGLDDRAVAALLDLVADATPRTASARFLNQLFGGCDDAAVAGELLAVALNTSMYTFKAAGANVVIEREVTRHMAGLVGFERGEGVLCPGGSLANFSAIVMARNAAFPDARERGAGAAPGAIYSSALSHYSITKGAAMAGIGRANVRHIACDQRGRMLADSLEEAIERDINAGVRPVMINATAGTTVLGAFDPIAEIATIAERFGVWLHVDGALGMSVILSPAHRALLAGVERADSVAWNAHKLMTAPLTCSAILTREPGTLESSFSEDAEYLFQSDTADVNFGGRSIQCGRRNDALKLWAAWKRHGDDGFGRRIDRMFELARVAAGLLRDDPEFDLSREPESVNVCFEYRGVAGPQICERLRREARLVIGYGDVAGRKIIRMPMVNPDLSDDDVRAAIEEIRAAGRAIRDETQSPAPCAAG